MGVIKLLGIVAAVVAAVGCTKTVNECSSDSDCKDVAYPFCDVNGEFGPSGGAKDVCTIVPSDCPIERCGCSPGATTCDGSTLSVCNMEGKSTTDSMCALGCADSKDHCLTFEPTNGLGAAMKAAAGEPDAMLSGAVTIDTDTGQIKDAANVIVPISSLVVSPGDIRVFIASSFSIADATVTGAKPVAFVSPGPIEIRGVVDASAKFDVSGPGAVATGTCAGQTDASNVGGGGGNATPGGAGLYVVTSTTTYPPGGSLQHGFELSGGCRGGGPPGGAGGGAVQLDSLTSIEIGSNALLDVGGGGARENNGGGGSGGNVILEAPTVSVLGGIVANGGSGSACGVDGTDGQRTAMPALAPICTHSIGAGNGGTATDAPGGGSGFGVGAAGGGGGAVGRLRVATSDGTMLQGTGALLSIVPTLDTLVLK
ncbi:MAG: hypothetical protein ABI467_17360 [Kofleriaceae bacterium]